MLLHEIGSPQGLCACGSSILSEGEGHQLAGEALGGVASICTGDFEFLSSSFLPLPPVPLPPSTIHFPLPALHFLLSFSTVDPKSSFWIQGGQDSQIPSPHTPSPVPQPRARAPGFVHLFWPALSMTLETKLTMADAGWLGSSSAKRWQALSVVLPCFRATKPKSLQGWERMPV